MKLWLWIVGAFFVSQLAAIRPADEVTLTAFNKTYYLQNEVYTFNLVRTFQVPLQIFRHRIYTSTEDAVKVATKRALKQNKDSLLDLAPEDHDRLTQIMGTLPDYVKVNKKKRALPANDQGIRVIPLTPKHFVIHATYKDKYEGSKKRGLQADTVTVGTSLCLHIPFFTTCDNNADLASVKDALQFQVDAIRTELDSYKKTNDARANEMASVLNKQRDLITQIIQSQQQTNDMVALIASSVSINAAQIAHGDYVAHAQINYLKRVTDSLLKYSNALASSDPRTVVAQPSMTKLFEGYTAILKFLNQTENQYPIVDSRVFTFVEKTLPQDSVSKIDPVVGTLVTAGTDYIGFAVFLEGYCTQLSGLQCKTSSFKTGGWIYGPFHQNHYGIYPLLQSDQAIPPTITQLKATEMKPIVDKPSVFTVGKQMYCIQFLGYKMLADFSTTPNLKNGIPVGSTAVDISDCNPLRLKHVTDSTIVYRLFSINEGVVIPFYSNCPLGTLRAAYPAISLGYQSQYPDTTSGSVGAAPNDIARNMDVYSRNWVTPACYINLEPGWLDMKYYIPDTTVTIPNIPRGYKLNQFTINPAGELASSLEFLYTNKWAWVYTIERASVNNIITDEVDVLDGDLVIFEISSDSSAVVDESDAFFGEGNNGRDCIRKSDEYDHDLLSCFYQNDQKGYTTSQYLTGSIQTTGIARFNNKYSFTLQQNDDNTEKPWSFQLIPKAEADFGFYVETDGFICPRLITRTSTVGGCTFTFSYSGTDPTELAGKTRTTLSFVNGTAKVSVPLSSGDDYTLRAGNPLRDCLILPCTYGTTTSSVKLVTPNVEIFPASEKNLVSKVYFAINATIDDTINDMKLVQKTVLEANENLTQVMNQLALLNFNVSELVPYEDFTELRKQVDAMIAAIPESNTAGCESPWVSADCFFQQFGTTLITIAVVIGVVVIGYLVFFKFGLAKKIAAKVKGVKSKGAAAAAP